jgi:hypothetical protein
MPRQLDPRIRDILVEHGEDPNDKQNVLWDCHGTWVVYHRAIERIAARAGITFDPPTILRAERDEAVILVHGELKGRRDWDIGECLVGVNYRVSQNMAAYVWAMATKRARDRLVLKLIGLHGLLYSEDEDDAFGKRPAQVSDDARPNGAEPPAGPVKSSRQAKKDGDWDQIAAGIASCRDTAALLDWVSLVQAPLQRLSPAWQAEAREAWAKALASKLVEECHQPSEVRQWGVDYAAGIEAMPMEWINTARQVCSEHVRALKAAQPVEVMA